MQSNLSRVLGRDVLRRAQVDLDRRGHHACPISDKPRSVLLAMISCLATTLQDRVRDLLTPTGLRRHSTPPVALRERGELSGIAKGPEAGDARLFLRRDHRMSPRPPTKASRAKVKLLAQNGVAVEKIARALRIGVAT